MFGFAMLTIVAAYVLFARFVTKRMPTRKLKWVAVAVFVLIPTGDSAVGYVYFRYLCATEAGNKIYKTAENVEGFYGGMFFADTDGFTKYGYKYFEDAGIVPNEYKRYMLGTNGRVAEETVPTIISGFGIRYVTTRKPMEVYLHRYEIYDMKTDEVYATSQYLGYRGGWIYTTPGKIIGMSSGASFSCQQKYALDNLILQVLQPTK